MRHDPGGRAGRRLAMAAAAALFAQMPFGAGALERGLTVPLRAGLEPDAPIADKFRLYRRSKALVIGIDAYRAGWPPLAMAVADARRVAAELERQGFDVTLRTDLDAIALQAGLERFFVVQGADPEARLFLWYAGHGHTLDGEGYLVPADAPRPGAGDAFREKALAMRRLGDFARLAAARHVFAVFDSCFSGTIFGARRDLPPTAITRATTEPVRQFLTSGAAAQSVTDDGAFRALFLAALRGEAPADSNGDGYLMASELGLFLNRQVSQQTGARQTPQYGKLSDRRFDRGDFVFALPSAGAGSAAAPAEAGSAELARWRAIADSDDPATFDAYLARYPDGAFVEVARMRQQQLRARLDAAIAAPATAGTVPPRRQPPEDVTWLTIEHSVDPVDFELYLERFPNGRHAAAARDRLAALRSVPR